MCGIIGYIGKQEAGPILLDGLRNLEYRGYDSAGLAVLSKGTPTVIKAVGKVENLVAKAATHKNVMSGSVGIAHTRWATHGGVSEVNAHPHRDCEGNIFVVHNGIIENYRELTASLCDRGHRFLSETDTEVLPHLIEEIKRLKNVPLEEAVRQAVREVRGTYGILVLDAREPEKIVVARNASPLLLGLGDGELVVASDATAIVKLTKNVVYLSDGELAVLTPQGHRVFTVENRAVERQPERIEWDVTEARKGGYPHFMLKEMMEEPDAIRNSIRGRLIPGEGKAKLGGLESVEEKLRNIERLIISGCGTAYHAGKVGELMLEEYAGIPTEVELASEFRYRKPLFNARDAFLVVSQSGETADTLASLNEAKEKGVLTLGVVNVVGSTIARTTEAGVYQHVGPEIGVASTKAFTSQVAIFALLTLFLGRKRGLSLAMGERVAEELERIPGYMENILTRRNGIEALAKKYQFARNFFFLGRKYNYPIALEGALKLKEVSYVHAEGYGMGELKHGPIALIDEKFPSIAITPRDSVYEKTLSNLAEVKARGGPIIAIATEGDEEIKKIADDVFYIPKTLEMLTPLLAVIPLQLFAYYFGVLRGSDVDRPRNLAKSVTVA